MLPVPHRVVCWQEFSRLEYWSVLPFPSPGDFPSLGMEPESPALQTGSSPSEPPGKSLSDKVGLFSVVLRVF